MRPLPFGVRLPAALAVLLALGCGEGEIPTSAPPPGPPPPSAIPTRWIFGPPIAGTPMRDVFYGAYLDHQGADYACLFKWYSGHKGVDILLRNFQVMDSGVPVLAAAPGQVYIVRDGLFDRSTENGAGGFGNYVGIEHGAGGPYSYYGHLRKGSIRVANGARVGRGDTLGLVGSSGNSNWPHLHFEVDDHGTEDPFIGPCNPNPDPYSWLSPLPWQGDFAVLDAGIVNRPLGFAELLERPADVTTITAADPVVTFWSNLLNVQASGTRVVLTDPRDSVLFEAAGGPFTSFSTRFAAITFPVAGRLTRAGLHTIALWLTPLRGGDPREVVRRTFTFDPAVTAAPGRLAASPPEPPAVRLSPNGGEARPPGP